MTTKRRVGITDEAKAALGDDLLEAVLGARKATVDDAGGILKVVTPKGTVRFSPQAWLFTVDPTRTGRSVMSG